MSPTTIPIDVRPGPSPGPIESLCSGAAATKTAISLRIPKSASRKIGAALADGKKVHASVHVIATDAAGNASNASKSITIARSRHHHKS